MNEKKKLTVVVERCPQNHICPSINVCPVDALQQNNYEAPTINHEKCIKCGKCVKFCPKQALVFKNK